MSKGRMERRGAAGGMIRALGAQPEPGGHWMRAAFIETDGITIAGFGESARAPLPEGPGDLAERVETAAATALSQLPGAGVVGFDGLILDHDAVTGRLDQAGDGAILAEVLGLPVVWDMRASDMALGGQGAPIEAFFHHACARWAGLAGPVSFLGLGDRAVLTWVDSHHARAENPGTVAAFEAGPQRCLAEADAAADTDLIAALMQDGYFLKFPPKWIAPGAFAAFHAGLASLPPDRATATARAGLVASVAHGFDHFPQPPGHLYLHGPGRDTPALLADLAAALPCPVAPVEALGLNGDAMGAQAIAWLAVRILRGLPTSGPGTTGVAAAVGGGQISRPVLPPT